MPDHLQQHFERPPSCPYCGSDTIEGDSIEIEGDWAEQPVRCLACDRGWTDRYRLEAILDDGNQPHRPRRVPRDQPAEQSERNLRQRQIVPPDRLAACRPTIIGVGAIGRQVALQLAAMGVSSLQLIDPDAVETVNLAPQGYLADDLGRPKVEATADLCQQIHPMLAMDERRERFRRTMELGDVIFCCVDAIEIRQHVWYAVRDRVSLFVDGRMSAETIRIVTAADEASREHYPSTLFAAGEAHRGACTARSTVFTASVAAGLMLEQLARHLRRMPIEPDLQLNLLASELTVPSV